MPNSTNTKILYFLALVIVLITIYYIAQRNGFIEGFEQEEDVSDQSIENDVSLVPYNTRKPDDMNGDLIDKLVTQYTLEEANLNTGTGTFKAANSETDNYGSFQNYEKKRQINDERLKKPYMKEQADPRDFSYRKKKFTIELPEEIEDKMNSQNLLPQEVSNWFDVTPLETTKKIEGTHLLNPKIHMGVNTVGSSKKNGTHDIRGDIVNPKVDGTLWNYSTIEPDTNIRGLCNPI